MHPQVETDPFTGALLLNRSDPEWIENVGEVRHYLYPVHVSRMFLVMPTLAASLYLLLLRFLDRAYADVFRMADSCVSDTALSPEGARRGGSERSMWRS